MVKCTKTHCVNNKAKYTNGKNEMECTLDSIELYTPSWMQLIGAVICSNYVCENKQHEISEE